MQKPTTPAENPVGHATSIDDNGNRYWAACRDCKWYGPVRETWDAAQVDQDAHIVETEAYGEEYNADSMFDRRPR